jgi:leucyl-tRNA synthetase
VSDDYDFQAIETRWREYWDDNKTFRAANPGQPGSEKPKYYVLDMFPYPSGVGLHVGHPLGYIATDIYARYKRMKGFNVLHPMGFDAFGLPAEQFAVEHGVHPRVTTEKNIANIVEQLKRLGLAYDWDRSFATTDVDYYKWTQWIFLQLYNSYFDPVENRALPLAELVKQLESGEIDVGPFGDLKHVAVSGAMDVLGGVEAGNRKWYELSVEEQDEVLAQHRLAYQAEAPVNWCPALGTVLADEEVTAEGRSERGNHPVYKRPLRQWMLRITAYAERLAADLAELDWPDSIKLMQRNWIGRSEGAFVDFAVDGSDAVIRVFTTRPDTLFGATYMVLAPEHLLVGEISSPDCARQVREYQRQSEQRSDVDRMAESKEKTGVFTGAYAINPVNSERIPIWIADYVLIGYGTGAIMAVPAHDDRDFEFARQYDLPIPPVVMPPDSWFLDQASTEQLEADGDSFEQRSRSLAKRYAESAESFQDAFTGSGISFNSPPDGSPEAICNINGLTTDEAKAEITRALEEEGVGEFTVNYRLRDWLFSRQRYWGEPFPILHSSDGRAVALDEADLPVTLPQIDDFTPLVSDDPQSLPESLLGRAKSWAAVQRDGRSFSRELNTMPQWAGSCWYYVRFTDPHNLDQFADPQAQQYWMEPSGVDLYVGGAEHAVLHLLYARFWHKVLYDLGWVSTPEPFAKLFNQGHIQAYAYTDERGAYVDAHQVEQRGDRFYYEGRAVTPSLGKMGKSLKNAVSPEEICERYGADSLRLYEMYMGPLDAAKPWNPRDVVGMHRFCLSVWRNIAGGAGGINPAIQQVEPDDSLNRFLHKTVKKVGEDIEGMRFNTAIAELIKFNNEFGRVEAKPRVVAKTFVRLLAPFAPHLAEELWERLGEDRSVAGADWPEYDEVMTVDPEVEYPVQVNGKLRCRIKVAADAGEDQVREMALGHSRVVEETAGKTVRKVVFVPGRLVNIVAN